MKIPEYNEEFYYAYIASLGTMIKYKINYVAKSHVVISPLAYTSKNRRITHDNFFNIYAESEDKAIILHYKHEAKSYNDNIKYYTDELTLAKRDLKQLEKRTNIKELKQKYPEEFI